MVNCCLLYRIQVGTFRKYHGPAVRSTRCTSPSTSASSGDGNPFRTMSTAKPNSLHYSLLSRIFQCRYNPTSCGRYVDTLSQLILPEAFVCRSQSRLQATRIETMIVLRRSKHLLMILLTRTMAFVISLREQEAFDDTGPDQISLAFMLRMWSCGVQGWRLERSENRGRCSRSRSPR